LGNLAQQRTGALLLLFEEQVALLIGDEAHIDEDLTDATDCHKENLKIQKTEEPKARRCLVFSFFGSLVLWFFALSGRRGRRRTFRWGLL
jgi:hypothetical protein